MDKKIDIANDITFLDVNGNALTQSQAFQGFTNYFVESAKLLKYVSKPTDIIAGRKSLNYVYESLIRPEMLGQHLKGEEVHKKARKGKRTKETTIKINEPFSTLPDEFDGLIDQFRGNGKFTISDTAMKSHAQEVAVKVDKTILEAHMGMKRETGDYKNITTLDVANLESFSKDEANKLVETFLRKKQIITNRETSQNVGREDAEPVAMVNPLVYTAIMKSDFYRAYNAPASEKTARTGRISFEQLGGIDIVEIRQFDPINEKYYPEFKNIGAVISVDNVGGDAITEPAQSSVAGGSTIQTYNIRGIMGFGSIRDEEDQRIEFITLTESGVTKPTSVVEVTEITPSGVGTALGTVVVEAFVKDGTTPKIKLVKAKDNSIVGTAQDVTDKTAKYTFAALAAGEYKAQTTSNDVVVAESDLIIVESE